MSFSGFRMLHHESALKSRGRLVDNMPQNVRTFPLPQLVRSCRTSNTDGEVSQLGRRGSINKDQTPQREKRYGRVQHFMNDMLNKSIVLVLNRNWQAINIRSPQEAFC